MRIAVDAMGGDFAPREVVEGAILAQTQLGVDIALVGDRDILANYLKQHNYQESDHLEIVPSEGIIEMDDGNAAHQVQAGVAQVCWQFA